MRREGRKGAEGGNIREGDGLRCRVDFRSRVRIQCSWHKYRRSSQLVRDRLNPHGQANTDKKRPKFTHSHSSHPSPHISTLTLTNRKRAARVLQRHGLLLAQRGLGYVGVLLEVQLDCEGARVNLTCERAGLNICGFISPLISMGMWPPLRTREKEVSLEDDVTAAQCIQFPVIKKQGFDAHLSTATVGKLLLCLDEGASTLVNDISSDAAKPQEHRRAPPASSSSTQTSLRSA
jgi:hypothetical protein